MRINLKELERTRRVAHYLGLTLWIGGIVVDNDPLLVVGCTMVILSVLIPFALVVLLQNPWALNEQQKALIEADPKLKAQLALYRHRIVLHTLALAVGLAGIIVSLVGVIGDDDTLTFTGLGVSGIGLVMRWLIGRE